MSVFMEINFLFPLLENFESVLLNEFLEKFPVSLGHLRFLGRRDQFEHFVNGLEKFHLVFPLSLSFRVEMWWFVVV